MAGEDTVDKDLKDFMPGAAPGPEVTARAGAPIDPKATPVASREAVVAALKAVYDPEIPVNIYDLGLVYGIDIGPDGSVTITMTLTAPGCPVAGMLTEMVAHRVAAVAGVGEVEVKLVWDPPWTPERMSDEARVALDMF